MLQRIRQHLSRRYRRAKVRWASWQNRRTSTDLNVVIGAGGTAFPGWISLEQDVLDITVERDWARLFRPGRVSRLLAEHVLEHLDEAQIRQTLRLAHRYLRPGGRFRIAVPDGHRRDHDYALEVDPPKDGHKVLLTRESPVAMVEAAGFRAEPLEYFDQMETFHFVEWDAADGMIQRSRRFDRQTDFRRGDLFYTSLIVDAVKPDTSRRTS